jgi:hypothetical protein
MKMSGWPGFALWALVGGLYALACLAMMSIGVFILFIAIVTTIVATRTLRVWPEIIGLAVGAPATLAWVAARAWGLPQCGPGQRQSVLASASGWSQASSGTFTETVQLGCTEFNVSALLWSAVLLAAVAISAYAAAKRRLVPAAS